MSLLEKLSDLSEFSKQFSSVVRFSVFVYYSIFLIFGVVGAIQYSRSTSGGSGEGQKKGVGLLITSFLGLLGSRIVAIFALTLSLEVGTQVTTILSFSLTLLQTILLYGVTPYLIIHASTYQLSYELTLDSQASRTYQNIYSNALITAIAAVLINFAYLLI